MRQHPSTTEKFENTALFLQLHVVLKTLFKPDEFENATFSFLSRRKNILKAFENDDTMIIMLFP